MSNHTPTPWHGWSFGPGPVHICDGGPRTRYDIATVGGDWMTDEEIAANARFIITACNLFDRLTRALARCAEEMDDAHGCVVAAGWPHEESYRQAFGEANAVLEAAAKAQGEVPFS